MAVDKLVDSAQLDADLSSVADAIRAKSGSNGSLSFPSGFVDAIDAIETGGGGGGDEVETAFIQKTLTSISNDSVTNIGRHAFSFSTSLLSVSMPNAISCSNNAFENCTALTSVNLPKLNGLPAVSFKNCSALQTVAFPSATDAQLQAMYGCSNLLTADFGPGFSSFANQVFWNCTKLSTLILRKSNGICTLGGGGVFANTPFDNGKTGGTIYIPKALYDHLGDGSSLDYKAATNWSTINGYGTITWAQIEGSIYETQYADGTPIT